MTPRTLHPRLFTRALLLLLVSALVAAGCGDGEAEGTAHENDSADTATEQEGEQDEAADAMVPAEGAKADGPQAEAELRVVIEEIGSKGDAGVPVPAAVTCTRSLPATCNDTVSCPVEGDDARAAVCAWLATEEALDALTVKPDPAEICTQIYGGPERATVVGTLDGTEVDASFSRQDGCNSARWDAVAPLWTGEVPGAADGAAGGGAAAGACLAQPDAPASSTDTPSAEELAADAACGAPATPRPEIITDPPEAF